MRMRQVQTGQESVPDTFSAHDEVASAQKLFDWGSPRCEFVARGSLVTPSKSIWSEIQLARPTAAARNDEQCCLIKNQQTQVGRLRNRDNVRNKHTGRTVCEDCAECKLT